MHAAAVDTNTSGSSTNAAETMESGAARERQSRVVMTLVGAPPRRAHAWQTVGRMTPARLQCSVPTRAGGVHVGTYVNEIQSAHWKLITDLAT